MTSTSMLGRKQSLQRGDFLPYELSQEETNNELSGVDWINKLWMRRLLRSSALICLVSVSLNTPRTFELYPFLQYITFSCDLLATLLFTAEMVVKINTRGLLKGEEAYLRDRWCLFDSTMLFFLWLSVILQILEMNSLVASASYLSIVRAPRPLIMIRFIRVFLKFSMPKNRINQIFKRSGQQIYNVTLFFVFFMSLYGLLGVQFFGELRNHCILNNTNPNDLTVNSLTIPDTYCSLDPNSGYQCPEGTNCIKLRDSRYKLGFNGFDEIATSIFTVYQASSQEGWVFIMYRAVDTLPAWRALIYFTTMIFFLSWLVKNVFIAVITETFNEIRVQFQQMWGERGSQLADSADARVLSGDDRGWRLVPSDAARRQSRSVQLFLPVLNSAAFHLLLMIAILANGVLTASMSFKHDGRPRSYFYTQHYYIEVAFTVFFNLEALFKIWCLGFKPYYGRTMYKFEFLLAIGTTLHLLPQFYLSAFTYFQVLRVVRLIKASPLLEDFVYKIFGPGKKLGSLIIFTMVLLIITSSISMQLFCCLADAEFTKFETFPEAFMSMFQILTQEAWVEVMDETMLRTSETIVPVVAVYFILYHLFVTLIVLSLFVAVILDNLELDEDIKKLKQMKAREMSAEIKKTLPRRLRLFEKFPDRPQMTRLHKIPSDFNLPKVRDSFVRQFMLESGEDEDCLINKASDELKGNSKVLYRKKQPLRLLNNISNSYVSGTSQKQYAISGIIDESNNQRLLLGDSGPIPIPGTGKQGGLGGKGMRSDQKKTGRSFRGSVKIKQTYEHLKENGDLGSMNRTSTSRRTPDIDIKLLQAKRQQAEMRRNQREEDLRENHPYFDTPLFLVPRESSFRRLCQLVVYARYCPRLKDPITGKERKLKYKRLRNLVGLVTYLDWVMIFVTTLSCLSMMFETPRYRLVDHHELQIAECGFVLFMSLELGLKILADGLFFTPKALFKDAAGILDIFTLSVSLAMLCWMPRHVPQNSGAQLLLLLRCLRPMRIFILVPHMRKVVCELCRGFKEILLVSILLIVLMFVFASYGVQLYGGRLARCNDSEIKTRDQCVGVFLRKVFVTKMKVRPGENETIPAMLVPRVWANPRRFNFDNIGNAMQALFEVLSFKGWLDIRDVLIKTLGPVHAIYIHIFVFLGCMIGLTLFVGVVIANYSENKGTALLTVDQRRWCDLKKRLKIAQPLHLPPRPDGHLFRAFIYDITQNIYFKRFIALTVIVNSSLLCVSWREDQAHTSLLATISSSLSFVFVLEVSMKMIAFTPHGYWQSRRNRYDTLVTVMGLVWAITNYTLHNDLSHSFGFVAIILRFFTITGKHATLKMLMLTVVVSVYKSFFIICGMFLLIFVYALTGCILFGTVKYGESLGRQANFSSTPRGIMILFRIVTGEDWYKIMHDCMLLPPFCTPGANYWETDCGSFTAAMIFFGSFYVIITYIVLNLLVAIIMENFSLFYSNEEDALLSYADIRNFQNTWNVVDVNQRGVIPVRKVKFVLRLLKGRLEVDPQKDRLLFKHMCFELERLHNGEDVTFHDVLNMLSYRSVDIRKSLQLEELLAREELEYIIEEEVAKQTIRHWLDSCLKRMRTDTSNELKEQNSLLAGLRATNESSMMDTSLDDKNREFGIGSSERESETKQEAEGSGKHRRKGMLVSRSDSINSVSGRRLFYGHSDVHSQQRSYDKERLGIGANPKKRSSRQSTTKGISSSNFAHSVDCSPGTTPVSAGQHSLIFPYPSVSGGVSTSWSNKGPGATLPSLNPPSAITVRVASAVSEVQDWWREQLVTADDYEDEYR